MRVNRRELLSRLISLIALTWGASRIGITPSFAETTNYGYFMGNPEGRLVHGIFELDKDFDYIDPEGSVWRVSAPFPTDGASIPPIFWPLIGHPLGGEYVSAAIVHDYFCGRRYPSSDLVHRNFYNGLRASGVSEELSWIMYHAVLWFGPTWTPPIISKECDASVAAFEPRRCMYNDAGPSGVRLPDRTINKENLEHFLDGISAKGFGDRAEQLRRLPKIREILDGKPVQETR